MEDSVNLKIIREEAAKDVLSELAKKNRDNLETLRALAINTLVSECFEVFRENITRVEEGTFKRSLIEDIPSKGLYDRSKKLVEEHAYSDPRVLQIECAGFQVLGGLLSFFSEAVLAGNPDTAQRKVKQLLPKEYIPGEHCSVYRKILSVVDYVSGMTDSFAVDLFQKLSGIKIPR